MSVTTANVFDCSIALQKSQSSAAGLNTLNNIVSCRQMMFVQGVKRKFLTPVNPHLYKYEVRKEQCIQQQAQYDETIKMLQKIQCYVHQVQQLHLVPWLA